MYSLPPNSQSFQVVCNPISGNSFGPSSSIDVDLGSRAFLDPKSLFIRYAITLTSAAESYMVGTPAYTPFLRVATMINSQTVETINSYNVLANMNVNLQYDVSQKLGLQHAFGYLEGNTTPVDNQMTDGGTFAIAGSKSLSAPLYCALSSCEKLVPLFLLNGIRLTFYTDSIVNMFSTINNSGVGSQTLPTNYAITNFEVCYNCIDFGSDVQNMVYAMDRIRIKSQTWASSVQTVASGATGVQNLIYNHKYSSIKALFLNMGGNTRSVSANGNMDSYNIAYNGEYGFQIAGLNYPQRSLSYGNNATGIIQMLRQAVGSVFDKNNAMSINSYEFFNNATNTVTTPQKPSKFWVGVSTEKLKVPGSFFTGISTESSPISAIINISGLATTQQHNVMLIVNADLIFEIDPATKQVVVIQ
jgi:hypothetical protein